MALNDLAIGIANTTNKAQAQAAVTGETPKEPKKKWLPLAVGGLAGGAVFFVGGKVAKLCSGCVLALTTIGIITGAYVGYEWRKNKS
jgi:predicted transporter